MKKAILIAEKPSLMREIQAAYREKREEIDVEIDFLSQAGHLVGLKLPSEIDKKYEKWQLEHYPIDVPYQYHILPGKAELLNKIKAAVHSGNYDFVIHAGDPDGEGELLVNLVLAYVKNPLPVKRFWTNDTTHPAIVKTLKSLQDDKVYQGFLEAALVRQHIDYQFGMNLTAVSSIKLGSTYRLGRVKAPIIRMIVDREREIQNFVEKSTWKRIFTYSGCEFVNEKEYEEKEQAIAELPNLQEATIVSVKEEKKSQKAPKLFKLSTLQTESYKCFGFSAAQTLELLQSLYETQSVSYPRTDCEYISSNVEVEDIIRSVAKTEQQAALLSYVDKVMQDKTYINDKAIASEGHTAIIPTGSACRFAPDSKEGKLYHLIVRRFLAVFSAPKQTQTRTVTAQAKEDLYIFKETYDLDPGYEKILHPDYEMRTAKEIVFQENAIIKPVTFAVKECKTKPPVRYNDGSLIKALDNPEVYKDEEDHKVSYSIGTPATRSSIIEQCIDCGYFVKEKGTFIPTAKAEKVIDELGDISLFDVTTSGAWESMLEGIRKGEKDAGNVEETLLYECHTITQNIKERNIQKTYIPMQAKSFGKCPNCGKDIVSGKYGAYCTGKCGITLGKIYGHAITEKQLQTLLSGKKVFIRQMKNKNGKTYDAYFQIKGVEDFSYIDKNGVKHEGKQCTYDMTFPSK